MNRRQQILLLCACTFVAALEIPRAMHQVQVDIAGPYASPSGWTQPGEQLARSTEHAGEGNRVSTTTKRDQDALNLELSKRQARAALVASR